MRCGRHGEYSAESLSLDPPPFDRKLYHRRNVIERIFNRFKKYRGLATRYNKHTDTFMAGITLAAIRIAISCNEYTAELSAGA